MTRVLFFFFLVATVPAAGQSLKKLREFKVGHVAGVAIDRLGNFFIEQKNGEVKKYNSEGKVLASLKRNHPPTLIEPWFHPKIFVYDREGQQCIDYDRNFQNADAEQLDPAIAVQPILVCPTNDNKLLVLDGADWSIKKVNPVNHAVIFEFYIDSALMRRDFTYLREYQNLIFLLDKQNGIVIYNTIGKKVNMLKTDANNFGFFGEELYFLQDGNVVFYDLYTEKLRLVNVGVAKFVLVSDEEEREDMKLILLIRDKGKAEVFEYNGRGEAKE